MGKRRDIKNDFAGKPEAREHLADIGAKLGDMKMYLKNSDVCELNSYKYKAHLWEKFLKWK
jgi:hypothetical protein